MRLPDGPSLKISEQKDVQTPEEIAAECGDLGVMPVPEGADASQVYISLSSDFHLLLLTIACSTANVAIIPSPAPMLSPAWITRSKPHFLCPPLAPYHLT